MIFIFVHERYHRDDSRKNVVSPDVIHSANLEETITLRSSHENLQAATLSILDNVGQTQFISLKFYRDT